MDLLHSYQPVATQSLKALLADSVDFAGTFPPASLSLGEAVDAYRRYRETKEAWMLGRFVCEARRLTEMESYFERFRTPPPVRFSVLAGDSRKLDVFHDSFERDVEEILSFRNHHRNDIRIAMIEVKVPAEILASDVIKMSEFLRTVGATLGRHDLQRVDTFFELPVDDNLRQTLPILTGAIKARERDREQTQNDRGRVGIKIRTGGTRADAFPSTESVGFVISTCNADGVRFKATAGMHHPLRHYRESVKSMMHGFLNIFAASAFAAQENMDEKDLVAILNDQRASSFSFSKDGVGWKGLRVSVESIERARRDLAVSFGSCSFEEPVEDLRSLGLI